MHDEGYELYKVMALQRLDRMSGDGTNNLVLTE